MLFVGELVIARRTVMIHVLGRAAEARDHGCTATAREAEATTEAPQDRLQTEGSQHEYVSTV